MAATWYISELNAEADLTVAAAHTGTLTTPATVSFSTTVATGACTVEDLKQAFTFLTTPDSANNTSIISLVGQNKLSSSFTNGATTSGSGLLLDADPNTNVFSRSGMESLSTVVFGGPNLADLFSNSAALYADYITAYGSCLDLVNGTTASGAASLEIGQSMLTNVPGRFALESAAAITTGVPADQTWTGETVTNVHVGNTATVTFIISGTGTVIDHMEVVTTGSLYEDGDVVTITFNTDKVITLTLNPVHAAMLNGTLDSVSCAFPFITGDAIRVVYTVLPLATQENAAGDIISAAEQTLGALSFNIDFVAA